ncbi:MAG: hypothetical protein ABIY51_06745 [Ferruginibacter sp.]
MVKKQLLYLLLPLSIVFMQCSKSDSNGQQNNLNNRSVGASAKEILTSTTYQSINLQIQYMPGYPPDGTALNNVVTFLNGLINKPNGILISQSAIAGSGKTVLALTEVYDIEKANRTTFTSGSQLGIYLLFVDCKYTDATAVGLAYKNTSMVIFGQTVHESSGGIGQIGRTKLESITEEHEFGHLMGLVDLGSPMQVPHKDAGSNHCSTPSCLMFATTNLGNITGPIPVLDAYCKNDLTANGGK